jgi:hypothetical protein
LGTEKFAWKPNYKREDDIKIVIKEVYVDWIISFRIGFEW